MNVCLKDGGGVFSRKALAAVPVLTKLAIAFDDGTLTAGAALRSVSKAFRHNLLNLRELRLFDCTVGDGGIRDFMDALDRSRCAHLLVSLSLEGCKVDADGTHALADLLYQDVFPALEELRLATNSDITDVGVVALAYSLLHTSLRVLVLAEVGMGDKGISALANLVSHGRLKHMEKFSLSANDHYRGGITNEGVTYLARAIDTYGLPALERFFLNELDQGIMRWTWQEVGAIAQAVIYGCPNLQQISLMGTGWHGEYYDMLVDMLKAAGRESIAV